MRRIKISIATVGLVAIFFLLAFALLSYERFHAVVIKDTRANMERCMSTFRELLMRKGEGFKIENGQLLVGRYVVNGNFDIPDHVQEIFGGTATVFMGDVRISTNVLHADGRRAVGTRLEGAAYEAIFEQGKAFRGETLILGLPYLTAYDPIRDANNKIIGVLYVGMKKSEFLAHYSELKTQLVLILLGLLTVFTALVIFFDRLMKKAEREKEADNRFLQTLIDTIPNPVYYKDVHGKYIGGNKAFAEFLGTPIEQLIGKTVFEVLPPAEANHIHQAELELYQGNKMLIDETTIANDDGTCRDVINFKAPFSAEDGSLGGFIGTILDISKRKRIEVELKKAKALAEENAQRLEFVLEGSNDATWEWDIIADQGVINTKYYEMTEYNQGEVNLNFVFFMGTIHPDDVSEVQMRMQEHLEGKSGGFEAHYRMVTKSGKLKDVMMRGKIVRNDEDGRPTWMAGVITDVTEIKRLGDEVNKLHNLESIGLLAGGLAHDFNNVLNVIYGNISFARMLVGGNTAIVEPLTDAEEACERARELGIRLQALAQGNSPAKEPISLPAIIEPVAGTLFKGSNILPTIEVEDDNLFVEADPRQIRQVFENLLTNAKEAMAEGGTVTVNIENYVVDRKNILPIAAGDYIRITIKDSGQGIPEENLTKIFNPYFSTKDTYSQKGLGLGLSICHAILKRHNGHISVESIGGIGTIVTVYLPASRGASKSAAEGGA